MTSVFHVLIDLGVGALLFFHPGHAVAAASPANAPALGQIHHVFIVMLENKDADVTFGPQSPAPYLSRTLTAQGAYLKNYYGIGHFSLDNYIALVSGQAPNAATQADCPQFIDFASSGFAAHGQAIGAGCVYPTSVRTVADELVARNLRWREYAEDMGNDPARESAACGHPAIGAADNTLRAEAPTASVPQGDGYATRHDPFVYFHSIIDSPTCADRVVNLAHLPYDLGAYERTPNLVFVTPNLCNDAHDATCATGQPGGLVAADAWLAQWVPMIMASDAYKRDGLLLILFDEASVQVRLDAATGKYAIASGDASACCGEQTGPNTTLPGQIGPGGGRTGAIALSPFIKPGTVSEQPYNQYSTLKTIEAIFGLARLGYSDAAEVASFGKDVFGP